MGYWSDFMKKLQDMTKDEKPVEQKIEELQKPSKQMQLEATPKPDCSYSMKLQE